ncbi:MAG: cellulose 1 4-beta-cellobiosidase [Anaerolineaceae bacterium]|nr:MAG: cellulose 1 4-beta-cellobiosidase [Anaerolineaceae bacterium]
MKKPRALHFTLTVLLLLFSIPQMACSLGAILATPTPSSTPTPAYTPTNTPRPTLTPRPTATPNATVTAQYNDMVQFVQDAANAGYIDSANGEYHRLDDYSEAWAQINWYQWMPTGHAPDDFVFRAHMAWESASQTPDPSGCGILFRLQDDGDHYGFLITSDGQVHFILSEAYFNFGGKVYHGQNRSAGEIDFAMTAQGDTFNVFVNGNRLGAFYGHKDTMLSGELAYTVISGTNKDYGTRCEITNAELWVLKP